MVCRRRHARRSPRPLLGLTLLALYIVVLSLSPFSTSAQDLASRLILKDGSYQLVKSYEIQGDRVHYLSAERNEWEDLPKSLVDWPATEKYEKDRTTGALPEAVQLDKDLDAERELEEASLPQVAPGLRLPEDSGMFLLDNYKGEPQLVEVQQTAGDLNRNMKGNIFRGAINPVASAKQTIELEGQHAAVQSHVGVPSIYLKADEGAPDDHAAKPKESNQQSGVSAHEATAGPQQPQQPQQPIVPFDRFRIVRAEVKGGKRILGDVKRAVTGKVTQEQHFAKTTINRVHGGWLKITPTESLAPGEYAVVEMLGKEGMNLYVWDFGVNPNAPPNANPWKPDPKAASKPAITSPDQPAK